MLGLASKYWELKSDLNIKRQILLEENKIRKEKEKVIRETKKKLLNLPDGSIILSDHCGTEIHKIRGKFFTLLGFTHELEPVYQHKGISYTTILLSEVLTGDRVTSRYKYNSISELIDQFQHLKLPDHNYVTMFDRAIQSSIFTDKGYCIHKIDDDKFTVVENTQVISYIGFEYYDIRNETIGIYSWNKDNRFYKNCIGNRKEIEKLFGKILDKPIKEKIINE